MTPHEDAKRIDPYRTAAPRPIEPDYRGAWRERWRAYSVRKLVYRLALGAAAAPWLAALAGIPFPASAGLWLATLGPFVVALLGYGVTQFSCPSCSHPFTGSDFLGIPDGGAVPFWMGIYPSHCASCDIEVGATRDHAPAEPPLAIDPADIVPAIGRRFRFMTRLGLLAIVLFTITAAFLALLEPRGGASLDGYRERAKRYP